MATLFGGGNDLDRRAAAVALMPRPDGVAVGATVEDEHTMLLQLQRAKEHSLQQQRVCLSHSTVFDGVCSLSFFFFLLLVAELGGRVTAM